MAKIEQQYQDSSDPVQQATRQGGSFQYPESAAQGRPSPVSGINATALQHFSPVLVGKASLE
jgi:hypothetical protein